MTCGGSNLIKAFDLRPFHNWKYSVYICIWSDMLCQYSSPICIPPLAHPPFCPSLFWQLKPTHNYQTHNFDPKICCLIPHDAAAPSRGQVLPAPKMSRVDPDGGALKCQTIHCLYHWRGSQCQTACLSRESVQRPKTRGPCQFTRLGSVKSSS